jgi:hypothetical protein
MHRLLELLPLTIHSKILMKLIIFKVIISLNIQYYSYIMWCHFADFITKQLE